MYSEYFSQVKCQTCGQSGVHVLCGQLNVKEPVYVCSTCKPSNDEEGDDEELQAQLLKHEQRRIELLAQKDQIIKKEKERLAGTKKKQDDMIARIKAIFADDPADQESKDEDIKYIGSKEGARVQIVNKLTGDCVPVQGCPPPPPVPFRLLTNSSSRPNTAMGLPRRPTEKESSSSEEENEELNKMLKISAIFSGDDVGKLDAFLPKNCIAETPPPSKAETEVHKIRENLKTTESHTSSSIENTGISPESNTSDVVEENAITKSKEEGGEEKGSFDKPADEEQSDDNLEEILADEFIDQDSPEIGLS